LITPAGEHGRAFDLHTLGKLPYTLRWQARVSEMRYPKGFTIEATGSYAPRRPFFDISRGCLSRFVPPITDGQW
jgi:hypothetical protein